MLLTQIVGQHSTMGVGDQQYLHQLERRTSVPKLRIIAINMHINGNNSVRTKPQF